MYEFINQLRQTEALVQFTQDPLLRLIFVGLAFGFAALLVEIRLPLKYYWQLPTYALKQLFRSLGLGKKLPVWGYCLEQESNKIIPLAAIELLNYDSREVIRISFSNRLGQYGFHTKPAKFIVRAIKNYYDAPPFYNPENIQLEATDESFAQEVEVGEGEQEQPNVNLPLQSVHQEDHDKGFWYHFRSFTINLANGLLAISTLGSLFGWIILKTPLYGVLLAVGIVFMFIKIYILEAVGSVSQEQYA